MAYEQILTERRDDVMLLTLNRPDRLNAWTSRMSSELADAIVTGNNDPEVGAFVITGQGRGFCAGADIQDQFQSRLDGAEPSVADDLPPVRDWVGLVRECKPIVAAVNGPAIGVGLTMILPMDFIVAAESAKLSCRFVKMGITPELASSHFLVQRCGWGHASDLALSGRTILGAEAAQIGLVDEVVADDAVVDRALERAGSYAENPDGPLRMIKGLITANAVETDLAAVHRREMDALNTAFKEPAHQEAVQAFLEKRPPVFRR